MYKFIQPKYAVGVVGVVMHEDGSVLLVEHVFHAVKPWGLPGGWMKRNEHPEDCIKRELLEELELRVEIERLLGTELSEPGLLGFAYLCRPTGPVGQISGELLDWKWTDPGAVPSLVSFHQYALEEALNYRENKSEVKNA